MMNYAVLLFYNTAPALECRFSLIKNTAILHAFGRPVLLSVHRTRHFHAYQRFEQFFFLQTRSLAALITSKCTGIHICLDK